MCLLDLWVFCGYVKFAHIPGFAFFVDVLPYLHGFVWIWRDLQGVCWIRGCVAVM